MNRAFFALILYLCVSVCQADVTAQKNALNAHNQYDAQEYTEAVKNYEKLLSDGIYTPEIFYNLGNAYFKSGDVPRALLSYRRAWYFMPNDPDLRANMKLAAESAGITLPKESFIEHFAFSIPQMRWVHFAQIGYLLTTALIIAAIALSRGRRSLLKCAIPPLLLALIACLGIWKWNDLYQADEQALLAPQTAKFGPTESSTDHFTIPAGSIVKTHQILSKGWRRIELDQTTGWIKNKECQPVAIWMHP